MHDEDSDLIEWTPDPRAFQEPFEVMRQVAACLAAGGRVLLVDCEGREEKLRLRSFPGTTTHFAFCVEGVVGKDWQFDFGDEWPGGWDDVRHEWIGRSVATVLEEVARLPTGRPKRFRRPVESEQIDE